MTAPTARPVFLLAVEQPELVTRVERALREAGIVYLSGLQADPKPMVVFSVGESDLAAAKAAVEAMLRVRVAKDETPPAGEPAGEDEDEDDEESGPAEEPEAASFPRGALQASLALVLVHFAILFAVVGREPSARHLAEVGGLVVTPDGFSPLRLVTSLFLHADAKHVLWNAVSLVAFAVPVIQAIGYARASIVYFLAGLAGGGAALAAYAPGTVTIGSSGAVSGLFGAWLAIRLWRARHAPRTRHAFVRAFGIGLLVLPSLVPSGAAGEHRVSIASHLGGLAAGLALGTVHEVRRLRAATWRGVP